jgi:hypothetical protein
MLIRKHDDVTAIFYSKERRGEARLVEDLEVNISFFNFLKKKNRIVMIFPYRGEPKPYRI